MMLIKTIDKSKLFIVAIAIIMISHLLCSQTVNATESDTETITAISNSSTYIHYGSTAGQHENESTMLAGTDTLTYHPYVDFDLDSIGIGVINTAKFRVYYSNTTVPDGTFYLYALNADWNASDITINNSPSNTHIATATANASGYIDFTVTANIVNAISGSNNFYGYKIYYGGGTAISTVTLHSTNCTDQTKKPQIIVEGKTFAFGSVFDSTILPINNNGTYKFLISSTSQDGVTTAAYNVANSDFSYNWEIYNISSSGYSLLFSRECTNKVLACDANGNLSLQTNAEFANPPQGYQWNIFKYAENEYVIRNALTGRILAVSGNTVTTVSLFTKTSKVQKWHLGYTYCTDISTTEVEILAGTYLPYSRLSEFITLNDGISTPTNSDNVDVYTLYSGSSLISLGSSTSDGIAIGSQSGVATVTVGRKDTTATATLKLNIEQFSNSYFIKNMGSGLLPQKTSSNYLMQYSFDGTTSQQWVIEPQSNGYSAIKNVSTNTYLQVLNNSSLSNVGLTVTARDTTATGQLFRIIYWGKDIYRIVAKCGEANGYIIGVQSDTSGAYIGQGGSIDDPSTLGDWHFVPTGQMDVRLIEVSDGGSYDRSAFFNSMENNLESVGFDEVYHNHEVHDADVSASELIYSVANSKIFVVRTHGNMSGIQTNSGNFNITAIASMSDDYFDYTQLVIYGACLTGQGGANADNLVVATQEAGVNTVIGFSYSVNSYMCSYWCDMFFEFMEQYKDTPNVTIDFIVQKTDRAAALHNPDRYSYYDSDGDYISCENPTVVGLQTLPN